MNRSIPTISSLVATLLIIGCASGDGQESGSDSERPSPRGHESLFEGRLALVSVQTDDSSTLATSPVVDGMLGQAFDSLDDVEYVSIAETGLEGRTGGAVDSVAAGLELDGGVALRIARLGSVVGVDLRIVDPVSGEVLHHDRTFSFIRYREKGGAMLFGPALYEALYRHVLRIGAEPVGSMPDGRVIVAGAEPLVIGTVRIERDSSLGRILDNRVEISRDGVRALGDFIRYRFNEFVVFDVDSRARLYGVVGLEMVEDHEPVGNLERQAMFSVDVPYFLTTGIGRPGGDSIEFSARLHRVTGPDSDVVVDSAFRRYEYSLFQTTTTVRDAIAELLVVSEELLRRAGERIRKDYPFGMRNER